jgi:hypothetical protein
MLHKGFISIAFFVLTLSGFQFAYAQTDETAVIDRFIAQQAKKADAEEYQEARKVLRGDVNGDKKTDLVVLYSLEGFGGGNNYIQYLAIFLGNGKTFRYATNEPVGGKLRRDIDLKSITGSTINLNTKEYRKNDAACCPSKSGKTRYAFRNGKLREIK